MARGPMAKAGVGLVRKVTVGMDTAIAAARVAGGGCSTAAN